MPVTPNFGLFPLGTHIYREPHGDQDALLADLPLLQRAGFNMIKIQDAWSAEEPREGEYDFGRIERLIARAGELGLGVYLGLTMEQAPMWMWQTFPDCRMVYANGQQHNDPIQHALPADGKPGPCWDHPGARAAGERFVTELARRLGRFDNIVAWNTWQEIGFWPNDGGVLGFCYCAHTLARFREWLQFTYVDLEALNRTWVTAYTQWDEVEPPRRSAFNPPVIDWRDFMDNIYISRALDWKTAALRAGDPGGRPVFSHVAHPRVGAGSEWRWAKTGDFFGNSNYPAWGPFHPWDDAAADKDDQHTTEVQEVWAAMMLRGDLTRSATGRGRAFWGAEFQGGPISGHLHMGRTPSAADIRRWMLAGLAAGMHGISFWNHRAEQAWQECNGFGLLDPRGDTTERFEEAGRLGQAVNANWELFALGEPPSADVALLVNDDLFHFCEGSDTGASSLLSYNLRGLYARLWRLGIPVDFVDSSEVADGALDNYRAAFLTTPLALDAAYFAHLAAFVRGGGLLISDACPGRFDKYGFCPRAQMVDGGEDLFGATHHTVRIAREPDGANRWTPSERGWGEFAPATTLDGTGDYAGHQMGVGFYLQTLTPSIGQPILRAGNDVAGVINRTGEGKAVLLGTFSGLRSTAHVDSAADQLFAELLGREAGIRPDRFGALLRRRRILGDREAWFLINPMHGSVTERINLTGFANVRDLTGETVAGEGNDNTASVTVEPAGIRCLILDRQRD